MPPMQPPSSRPLPTGDRGPIVNALQIIMILTASSAVLLRFVARHFSSAGLWWDDWLILAALILSVGMNINNYVGKSTSLGLGKHIWEVQDGGHGYLRSLFALEVIYTTALALNKLSILMMYQRLFGIDRRLTLAVKVVAAVVIAWWAGVDIATFLQCEPIERFWEYSTVGKCFDVVDFFEGSAIPNVIADVLILLLPQPILWKLQMSWSNKLALCGIFLLGAL
ncbi:integral membrane [Lecanosticta acicola]|uniref:Integral membrane n=1 Tax=Lecanosticta acicola TaxID=111012 RepID=A0AAI8W0G6_9PEZI|nr:integral membrane [Lecanosticta acicola]